MSQLTVSVQSMISFKTTFVCFHKFARIDINISERIHYNSKDDVKLH